jgi:hypothetical protein
VTGYLTPAAEGNARAEQRGAKSRS